jgi:hypothetical protein
MGATANQGRTWMIKLRLVALVLAVVSVPAAAADFWDMIAIVVNKDGTSIRLEVDKVKNLQECKNRAMVAYAHLPNGPIFCQHVSRVELIDVYGNARPVE